MADGLNGMEAGESQAARRWAEPVRRLDVAEVPAGAQNLNLDGRAVTNPLKGFGPLWQRTYRVRLTGVEATPAEVMRTWKLNFPCFQPPHNHFYATRDGVVPGELLFIESTLMVAPGIRHVTPIASGVMVMYVDETSFSVITPVGFPVSGWNTFSTYEEDGCTVAQVQVLDRSSDPIYELGYRFMGGERKQDGTWIYVLRALAAYYGVDGVVSVQKVAVDPRLQWRNAGNIWYNASLRTLFHRISHPRRGRGQATTTAPAAPQARQAGAQATPSEAQGVQRVWDPAIDLSVRRRPFTGQVDGFGQLWLKTYFVRLPGSDVTPNALITEWRANLAAFWPPGHRFFGTPQAITPGQVAVLNLGMPGGAVIYADDHAFTLTAPKGHMFAGIIACSAYAGEEGVTVAQIQALVRPSDPLYELGCRLGFGHTRADQFWHATLRNLAARFGVHGQPQQRSTLIDPRIRWAEASNLWQNVAVRRTRHMPVSLGQRLMRSFT
jgi:hypothetical protein